MSVKLKKLNFRVFAKNSTKMWELIDSNRNRLAPWFWWASKKVTPNKFRFMLFMTLYIADTKRKKITHIINPTKLYDEQFFVVDEANNIGGCVGLDNIDTTNNKSAEIWGMAFKRRSNTGDVFKILENYCINELNLKSVYTRVQTTNTACEFFWELCGYDTKTVETGVRISKRNPNIADMYTYTKSLVK